MPGGQGRGCLSQAPGEGRRGEGGGARKEGGEGGRERWGAWSSGVRELSRAPNTIDSSNSNNWGSKVQEFGSEAARVSTLSPGGCVGAWAPGRRDRTGYPRGQRPWAQASPEGRPRWVPAGAARGRREPAAVPRGRFCGVGGREAPSRGRGRAGLAGPRGGAGRQLDAAAIYGPFRRAGASSGRPLSRRPHNGAAAAAVPAPAAARGLHGREGPGAARAVRPSCFGRQCVRPRVLRAPGGGEPARRSRRLSRRMTRAPGPRAPRALTCARGRGARSSRAVGHPAPPGWHGPRRRVPGAHTGAHSSRLRATIWQIRVDTAAPAHSGAECPATGNNHNSVRVYYGCERARKKII